MGVTQAQIDEILKKGKADFKIPILSPISGHVVKKNVVEGQYVPEGQTMFEVADLHTVWVQAQVYEDQIGLVHVGQSVEASVEAFPGQTFPGQGRVHPAAPRPGDADGRGPVRPGQPRPQAPARDVRHGDPQDAGRRDPDVPGQARGLRSG